MENHTLFDEGRVKSTVELEKFAKLEEKIKVIVNEKVSLKKQIQTLEDTLKSKEAEIEGLKDKIKVLDEERNSVRARVDSLLDLIADVDLAK
ncbi:MAG: cell division protein ZapB [Deltaproteobacteria bacterium]|nr:cell division protein ZapB [Deltaproteobacteria bacterium]